MAPDLTEYQSNDEQQHARRLSLQGTRPPGEVEGVDLEWFLGSGAYGEVWVGVDRNTGRRVAVKFYAHRGGVDWPLLSREVEKLAFLSADRYVVQLLDVGWDAEPPYYTMEYVENGSLDDLLEKESLSVERAEAIFHEIVIGLQHAHNKGVLHCDLKPANILLDQDQRPRLADFGQARMTCDQTPALGTLFYMAPEQADSEAAPDARWDVYALGAMLYRMLTGAPPHRTPENLAVIENETDLNRRLALYRELIETSPAPQDHRRRTKADRALCGIVDRCLEVDPHQRFPNVQSVLDALQQRRDARTRRPLLLLGVVGPVLLLLVMAAFYWRGFRRAIEHAEEVVGQQAAENNEFTAKFVAKSFQAELADYFDIIEEEASQPLFLQELQEVQTHCEDVIARLNEQPDDKLREDFLLDPKRVQFKEYLQARLRSRIADRNGAERLASFFVVDPSGVMTAVAYAENVPTRSVGKNYAWRTYFHGEPNDYDKETALRDPPQPIRRTHLSAVFRSSTTKKWKVAVSTPIWQYHLPFQKPKLIGVMALTINLGDFSAFRNDSAASDYFPVLLDGREGERQGVILQHPSFSKNPPEEDIRLPQQQFERLCSADAGEAPLRNHLYHDPLGLTASVDYRGDWIAAMEPVKLPQSRPVAPDATPNLWVLVQRRSVDVNAPVRQLGQRLAWEGLAAMGAVMAILMGMWFFMLRIWRGGRTKPGDEGEEASVRPAKK